MKNLLKLSAAIIILAFYSCSKDYDKLGYENADVITNQGTSVAIIKGVELSPGQSEIVRHSPIYNVECFEGCKVNINGSIIYSSGPFENESFRKHKFE